MIIVQNTVAEMIGTTTTSAVPEGTAGVTTPSTIYSIDFNTVMISSSFNNYRVVTDNTLSNSLTTTNLTPSVCDISALPLVTKVSSGIGTLKLTTPRSSRLVRLDFTVSGGTTSQQVTGPSAGSFGRVQWDRLKALMDAGGSLDLLVGGVQDVSSNWNFSNATYNPACWAASLDFTGVAHHTSYWNTSHMAGTLVTDRVVRLAWHWQYPIGTTLTFISKDGTKYQRTVIAKNPGPNLNNFNINPIVGDSCVAVLDSPLPTIANGATAEKAIKVYKVTGEWIFPEGSAPTNYVGRWFGVYLDQQRKVRLCGVIRTTPISYTRHSGTVGDVTITNKIAWTHASLSNDSATPFLTPYTTPFLTPYTAFSRNFAIEGDSGCPAFAVGQDGELILATTLTFAVMTGPHTDKTITDAIIKAAFATIGITTGLPTVTVAAVPTL